LPLQGKRLVIAGSYTMQRLGKRGFVRAVSWALLSAMSGAEPPVQRSPSRR